MKWQNRWNREREKEYDVNSFVGSKRKEKNEQPHKKGSLKRKTSILIGVSLVFVCDFFLVLSWVRFSLFNFGARLTFVSLIIQRPSKTCIFYFCVWYTHNIYTHTIKHLHTHLYMWMESVRVCVLWCGNNMWMFRD